MTVTRLKNKQEPFCQFKDKTVSAPRPRRQQLILARGGHQLRIRNISHHLDKREEE